MISELFTFTVYLNRYTCKCTCTCSVHTRRTLCFFCKTGHWPMYPAVVLYMIVHTKVRKYIPVYEHTHICMYYVLHECIELLLNSEQSVWKPLRSTVPPHPWQRSVTPDSKHTWRCSHALASWQESCRLCSHWYYCYYSVSQWILVLFPPTKASWCKRFRRKIWCHPWPSSECERFQSWVLSTCQPRSLPMWPHWCGWLVVVGA